MLSSKACERERRVNYWSIYRCTYVSSIEGAISSNNRWTTLGWFMWSRSNAGSYVPAGSHESSDGVVHHSNEKYAARSQKCDPTRSFGWWIAPICMWLEHKFTNIIYHGSSTWDWLVCLINFAHNKVQTDQTVALVILMTSCTEYLCDLFCPWYLAWFHSPSPGQSCRGQSWRLLQALELHMPPNT